MAGGAKYYDGPTPTEQQRADNLQFINEHLELYPNSGLAELYPYNARIAKATKAYRELEARRSFMDPIDYEIELQKITSQIDITEIKKPYQLR